jgi:GDP-mannose mannosyl hydrolase
VSAKLSKEEFVKVVAATPLVSIDLIVRNNDGEVLLGKRLNKPAQDYWFVPGGRILKDELIASAFDRLVRAELGLRLKLDDATFLGTYQHLYPDNFAGEPNVTTHYVVLAYVVQLSAEQCDQAGLLEDDQHAEQGWWHVAGLLASGQVHTNTKAYFDPAYKA